MTDNLTEALRVRLQYPPLKKADPATQDVKDKETSSTVELLGQSCISAVLTAMYKLSSSTEGTAKITAARNGDELLKSLFDGKETRLVQEIAAYAGVSDNQADSHLENVADEAVNLVQGMTRNGKEPEKLQQTLADQRHDILVHLPAALHLGDLLNYDQVDDNTNKMEGPVSGIMQKIGDKFSEGGS